ncbi:GNAT family N-acetyltransferase [Tropicimonas isoalkanivorans]|uniref:Protein N-acetyltransferase, RimJ/RimL family n=1 Tax=Tropicimonas isoalkanivorans TaxID=441112 RepID=A0A1I1JRA7_9RHOB|nr:GNAT family N-acetyltransferase [Tropicimonas isoalkanivorans]SFC50925.1 Protein N-acetyltransferase, RimJ/RimL family [Tropicimonas isoalkanivorans]
MTERLETERLILRRPLPSDMAAYQSYYGSDWRATHGPIVGTRQSRGRFEAILAHWQTKGFGRFVVERNDLPGAIGLIGPHYPDSFIEPEVTWQLWSGDFAGHGYAYEAAMEARRHAFETLGWSTAVTYIHSENRSAIALARRMGATLDLEAIYPASIGPHDVYRHPGPVRSQRVTVPASRRRKEGAQPPTLRTLRLVLRPYRAEDFESYATFLASPRASGLHGPYSRADAWSRFTNEVAHWPLYGYGGLMIEVGGEPAGFVAVTRPPHFPEPELGWSLFDGYEGRGFATEAAMTLREHIVTHCGIKGLVSYFTRENLASISIAERLGCRLDEQAARPQGVDCLVYRHPAADEDGSVEAYA